MESKVIFRDDQELQGADLMNSELFAEASQDHAMADTVGAQGRFTGFPITSNSATQVTVGAGRVYLADGSVYYNSDTGGVPLNMFGDRALVNFKIMNVVATPVTQDIDIQARDFLINAETLETEPDQVPMQRDRRAGIDYVPGKESANPQAPTVNPGDVLVAQILMGPAGILTITPYEVNRMRSLEQAHQRLDANDVYQVKVGSRLDTLGTDLTALSTSVDNVAPLPLVRQVAYDVAVLKDKANLPSSYSSYDTDAFLDSSKSDRSVVDYLALVEEGIRFPAAQAQMVQPQLNNTLDTTVKVTNNFMLPAFTENKRLSVVGNDKQVSISQYPYQTIATVQKTASRAVVRFGSTYYYCSNSAFWQSGRYDPVANIFTAANGDTYNVTGINAQTYSAAMNYLPFTVGQAIPDHIYLRLQQYWTDQQSYTYTDTVTVTGQASGSIVAQSVLNTQGGWLTSVNLYFAAAAAAGDVQVLVTQTHDDGSPDYKSVIAQSTLPVGSIQLYPAATNVQFAPVFLDPGDRFSIVLVSPGNHQICLVGGNKYAQGTFFQTTDGTFSQGDLAFDMAFEMFFAQFNGARVTVSMRPLTLPNGIANIMFNTQQVSPDGTAILHQVLLNGAWTTLDQNTPALGLPALLQYQIVFVGTTDVMPAISIGPNDQITTWRPGANFRHYSTARTLPTGLTTSKVQVQVRMENWNGASHTLVVAICYGTNYSQVKLVDILADGPAQDNPTYAQERTYTFNLPSAVSSYKIRMDGTTATLLNCFHVAGRKDLAL